MAMATSAARREILEGDLIIVFASRDRTPTPLVVQRGEKLINLFGLFPHDDMIGRPYGSKILYAPDMAFITMKLNLSPGAHVIEAGTGSGSFTHFLARTTHCTWPTRSGSLTPMVDQAQVSDFDGRVYSFEFHAERVEKARTEFAEHGLDKTVVLAHRNVCKNGFGLDPSCDAVFLDLPAPWEAVPHAKEALRTDIATHICCFSPCIEQVHRTVAALSEHGFSDITMYESLVRTHESLTNVAPLEPISQVVERIQQTESKRELRRQMQIQQSKLERERRQAEKETQAQQAPDTAEDRRHALTATVPHSESAVDTPHVECVPSKRKATDEEEPCVPPTGSTVPEPPAEMLYSSGFRQKPTYIRALIRTCVAIQAI
ncbi:guanidinoacetate N-methyltransferase [Malassezia caprae]|uniref:tRNA (adenine(58)-N(1))-methyltransferase catalytic subunit TRM61 n=1 Tax=Malassezia caprae TaxID=1381934 RepID=A0AAF0E3X0_9BASI|nr:guanidinoacetate N-methyltransferase [Malassezia caprae]